MFDELLKIAKEEIQKAVEVSKGFPEPQVIVFKGSNTYIYASVNDPVERICAELKKDRLPKILGIVVMWKNGTLDLPSMEFRKAILDINEANKDAQILLQGKEGFITKTLSQTLHEN